MNHFYAFIDEPLIDVERTYAKVMRELVKQDKGISSTLSSESVLSMWFPDQRHQHKYGYVVRYPDGREIEFPDETRKANKIVSYMCKAQEDVLTGSAKRIYHI